MEPTPATLRTIQDKYVQKVGSSSTAVCACVAAAAVVCGLALWSPAGSLFGGCLGDSTPASASACGTPAGRPSTCSLARHPLHGSSIASRRSLPTPTPWATTLCLQVYLAERGLPLADYREIKCAKCAAKAAEDFGFPYMLKCKR